MNVTVDRAELPGGVGLPYAASGDPDGVPMLLLPGLTDSLASYELVLPHLPPSVRAFAVTQRGHGDATRPDAGYRVDDFAADAVAFMDALAIDAAVIVGHSSHTIVARRVAETHPDRVRGLVLLGAPASIGDDPRLRAVYEQEIAPLRDPIDPAFVRAFQEGTFTRPVPTAFVERQVRESLKVPARVWHEAFGSLLDAAPPGPPPRPVPTLLIWGDRDEIAGRSDQEALMRACPGARLVVYEGTGHTPHWEEPERVARDLAAFAASLRA